jgi:hypothetical protein
MHLTAFLRFLGAALLAAGLAALAAPGTAQAQNTVIVLGIQSMEGDDEFAHNLTGALRNAASQVEGWNVSDREVTLSQMALAHGCDEPDPSCLAQMADSLEAGRLIYGNVRRTSEGSTYDFEVRLHLFNNATDRIEHEVTDRIPSVRSDIDDLRGSVRRYVAALSGAPRVGTLRLSVGVPNAEVFVDDTSRGTSNADGVLVVDDLEEGQRSVRIVAPGHQDFTSTVSIEAYGEAELEAELTPGSGSSGGGGGGAPVELIVGATMLVVAAGLAAGWIASWVLVNDLQNDPDFQAYRLEAGNFAAAMGEDGRALNVCSYAQQMPIGTASEPRAREVCNEADTFEILEFVFGFGALGLGAVGAYFLASGAMAGGSDSFSGATWQLVPTVGPGVAYLGVQGTF